MPCINKTATQPNVTEKILECEKIDKLKCGTRTYYKEDTEQKNNVCFSYKLSLAASMDIIWEKKDKI